MAYGVNIIGMPFGDHGLGQELRDKAAALRTIDLPFTIIETNYSSLKNAVGDREFAEYVGDEPSYDINLICLNLPMLSLARRDRPKLFERRYNIVLPFWEFEILPRVHAEVLATADEVWTPNTFLERIFQRSVDRPVRRMPLHVRAPRAESSTLTRAHFGVPNDAFVFLYIFDCNSLLPRKDPEAAILAFAEAFRAKPAAQIHLVLKYKLEDTPSLRWNDVQRMEALARIDPRITLINKNMTRQETLALIDLCDAYVSPHRAEGLGRTILEAMLLAKPVIATKWSGIADFLDSEYCVPLDYVKIPVGKDSHGDIAPHFEWALASPEQLRDGFIRLCADRDAARRMGARAKERIESICRPRAFGAAAQTRIAEIYREMADQQVGSRIERSFGYASGERQIATEHAGIREDHLLRYEWARDQLREVLGGSAGSAEGADIFCGNGYGTALLAPLGRLWAVDGSVEAIQVARTHFQVSDDITFKQDIFPFELPVSHFDFIVCLESIEHVREADKLATSLIQALKPGRFLVVSSPNQDLLPFDPTLHKFHQRHFTHSDLLAMFESRGADCIRLSGQHVYEISPLGVQGAVLPSEFLSLRNGESGQFNIYIFQKRVDVERETAPANRHKAGVSSALHRLLRRRS